MKPAKNLVSKFFGLFAAAVSVFVLSLPAFAYEEDTHFQMTYVILRSVGFTPDEAIMVAAVDQGMDDSPDTVANGGLFGAIPNVEQESLWHALDGYGILHGGTMTVKGILARRDQLFQAALKETTVRNKLIRLGVFFHYQQDTWGHRHHYEANHLSRDNYTTYNTPAGHAKDFHQPDRPPFDPVAALMNLEDGIVYANTFLKQSLGRDPNPYLANYKPQGGNVDTAWPKDGKYFHQISISGATPKDARLYLISLIRAQIDTYTSSLDPRFGGRQTADEANLDSMRLALGKVCKNFADQRGPGTLPAIQIPTTAQKNAQGFTSMLSDWLKGSLPDAALIGVGRDGLLFTKTTLISNWIQIPNSGLMLSVDVMPDGTILGVGQDNNLWTRKTLTAPWVKINDSGVVIAAIAMPDGTILGVGADNNMWTRKVLTSDWVLVTNSGYVKSVAVMPDGTLLGVGRDNFLFTKATVQNSNWIKIDNSGFVVSVTVLADGTIIGVGTDNNLFTRATPASNWVPVPNSGYVRSVAETKF